MKFIQSHRGEYAAFIFARLPARSGLFAVTAAQTPSRRTLLPERTRLLQKQLIDIVIEVRNAPSVSNLRVTTGSVDLTSKFGGPVKTQLDCDESTDWVIRADFQSFDTAGVVKLAVALSAGGTPLADSRSILIRPFSFPSAQRRNIILFIGDAMGTAYRDAARLVYRANRRREWIQLLS